MDLPTTLTGAALQVMDAPDPADKVRLTYAFAKAWQDGEISDIGDTPPPARPARPAHPILTRPGDMPKRSKGGAKGRVALVHAIQHIELNAIDLAWDIIARFASPGLPKGFYDDWVKVADDEARHFEMLGVRLNELGARYGDLPAHDGLWEAATKTSDDVLARLALVPMLLEARGLDTTPATVTRLQGNGDDTTASIMAEICEDEISHVAAGVRWFEYVCKQRDLAPVDTYQNLIRERYNGQVREPFNRDARDRAQFNRAYYEP